jgi:glycerophosphoryl diester phosphodiesterase
MHPALLIAIIICAVLAVLFIGYLFLIMTGSRRGMEKYKNVKYAHRGLHGDGRAENSMSAFKAAVDAGFGVELDVRLSKDGVLVVFHDDDLKRVCSDDRRVADVCAKELSEMSLSGTADGVPTFEQVLKLVGGRVPLLVEIKENPGDGGVSEMTARMLSEYSGDYIVESFNPLSLKNARRGLKRVPMGILSMKFEREERRIIRLRNFALGGLLTNFLCRPNFIAYRNEDGRAFPVKLLGGLFGAVRIAWTVRSEQEEKAAYARGFDTVIFEGYLPSNN